jgi:asparagine N-glycosylation enzyme membrane subunit Stt3
MKKELDFFEKPKNKKALWIIYIAILVLLLTIDLFIPQHAHFYWDGIPVFYALFGFAGCVLLAVIAKNLRPFLKREENYYD